MWPRCGTGATPREWLALQADRNNSCGDAEMAQRMQNRGRGAAFLGNTFGAGFGLLETGDQCAGAQHRSGRRRRIVVIFTVMSMQQRPLTNKQETFVRKVAEGMAASRAYREAGYTATAHAAEVMASKTLRKR